MDVAEAGPPSLEGRRADALCSALSVVLTMKLWPIESVGIVVGGREAIISKIAENYL
jgi:nitrate reductase NapE component